MIVIKHDDKEMSPFYTKLDLSTDGIWQHFVRIVLFLYKTGCAFGRERYSSEIYSLLESIDDFSQ